MFSRISNVPYLTFIRRSVVPHRWRDPVFGARSGFFSVCLAVGSFCGNSVFWWVGCGSHLFSRVLRIRRCAPKHPRIIWPLCPVQIRRWLRIGSARLSWRCRGYVVRYLDVGIRRVTVRFSYAAHVLGAARPASSVTHSVADSKPFSARARTRFIFAQVSKTAGLLFSAT
jgi:hypothetical protein